LNGEAVRVSGVHARKRPPQRLLDMPRYVWLDEPLSDLDDVSVNRIVALLDA